VATKTNAGLVAYAKAQVGLPYWYGTYGQTANASLLSAKKKQYPDYYTADDFKSQYGKRVHDCSGLIKGYLWSDSATSTPTYKSSQDKSATGLYTAATMKDKISTFPKTAGLLVFRGTSTSNITHVGVYGGDGYVYEAKNHASGVCKTAYKQSDWNYWAQCSYITDDTAADVTSLAVQTTAVDEKTIWDYLYGKIGNAYGVAGLMGNLYAESALIANNLENTYNTKLDMTDKEYTDAVDSGSYTAFSSDSAGYGLAQWTYSTRKKALLEYAVAQKASVGSLSMQLAFLYKEMSESYGAVLDTLKNATSVLQASNIVLTKYEIPADTGTSVQTKRAGYGQTYYDKYAGISSSASSGSTSTSTVTEKTATDPAKSFSESLAGTYKVSPSSGVNVRNGAGTGKSILVALPKDTKVQNYGYYTSASGVKWLYIQVTYNNIKYTGFCCGTYLKKQ